MIRAISRDPHEGDGGNDRVKRRRIKLTGANDKFGVSAESVSNFGCEIYHARLIVRCCPRGSGDTPQTSTVNARGRITLSVDYDASFVNE